MNQGDLMALYRQETDGLVPVRRVRAGAELYEREIEQLAWTNLEEITGLELFPICRQGRIPGGVVDILALSPRGEVTVIEVKRAIDRSQLAQCLEYAGWARSTNLDELAGLYHGGTERFWADWQDFTGGTEPVRVHGRPSVVLIAQDFDARTRAALDFLTDSNVPVTVVGVTVYEASGGERFVDVEGVAEPSLPEQAVATTISKRDSLKVSLQDLLDAGLLHAGTKLVWPRPMRGVRYTAEVTPDARIRLEDGRVFKTPSGAAMAAAETTSYDGWHAWRISSDDGQRLHQLRIAFAQAQSTDN